MVEVLRRKLGNIPALFTKSGNINGNIKKILPEQLMVEIIKYTGYLPNTPTIAERIYNIFYDRPTCAVCSNLTAFKTFKLGYQLTCSRKCGAVISKLAKREHSINKYGFDNPSKSESVKAKIKQTKLNRYGDKNYNNIDKATKTSHERYGEHFSRTQEFVEKIKATNKKLYGNENYNNREKAMQTCNEKYGVNYYSQTDEAKQNKIFNSTAHYGVKYPQQRHFTLYVREILFDRIKFNKFVANKHVALIAHQLNVDANTVNKYISLYNSQDLLAYRKSKYETIIKEYLNKLGIKYVQNTRTIIPPQELDFYLPEHDIAIEINGNYWHSEIAGHKDKYYHINKWKKCRKSDITLYQYFEDELINHLDVIKSKLSYLSNQNTCVIGARKCIIQDISFKEESDFLNKYHIQGCSSARTKCFGAFYNSELVGVFGYALRKHYLEITRFAVKTNASYPGLFSKMMKHMIKELNYTGEIVSFSNNGHSNGNVYAVNGFTNMKELGPAYWYMKDYLKRENRQHYMKNKIRDRFHIPQEEIDSKTEWQLMQEQGYDRIFDSGKIKWSKMIKGTLW